MPAITLGLAEVEDRLRALRRRLNAVTAQHSVYVSLSAIIVVITALIVLGLRGSASTFRAATWGGVVVCLAAAAWGVLAARRRWLDVVATARLTDRRAALTDRLVTLIDLRSRPRPTRLAPVLVAQVLALSKQWQPQQIAPRRVPRSVFALAVSLLALASTAFIERRPPEPTAAAQTGAGASGTLVTAGSPKAPFVKGDAGPQVAGGPSVPGLPPAGTLAQGQAADGREASNVPPRGDAPQGGSSSGPQGSRSQQPGEMPDASRGGGQQTQQEQPGGPLKALPDRLQEAIRHIFHAEALDKPQALAARSDASNPDPSGRGQDQQGQTDRQRRDAPDTRKNGTEANAPPNGPGQGTQKGPGKPKSGEQAAQQQDATSPNQNFEGNSPAAGDGSSPGGLMDGKGQSVAASEGAPKTFKLTITSFLHAMEQKGEQPRQAGKKTSTTASVSGGSGAQGVLSERQLNDDALRKAEIPPEYEDIVRRVYSLRGDQ